MPKKIGKKLAKLEGLDSPDRLKLLETIDKLRELGISEDISLPQLVVVGDQSSGKSSLLEGLTGLSFPVASELCTRFATQMVLRRTSPSEHGTVKVTIIPGPTVISDEAQKATLQEFNRYFEEEDFGAEEFAAVLDEAAKCMGLPSGDLSSLGEVEKRFSDDVLKIEIAGPDHHHLSVVDVPGLFHNPTIHQTQEDSDTIRALIQSYITDTRTIIMAVMDGRNNLANQEVFRMARNVDPQGLRTVGIITKCDALQEGDEQGVLNIAQNKVENLNHGWFAVKNRSTKEIEEGVTIQQRYVKEEAFFKTAPWNRLKKERVGMDSLKRFLGHLLHHHIRDEFPNLIKDIKKMLESTMEEIELLGPARESSYQQRQYLTHHAATCQAVVQKSLSGNYDPELKDGHPLKLRMHLRILNDEFAEKVLKKGHTKPFRNIDNTEDPDFENVSENAEENDINVWIRRMYKESRGIELPGTINPVVLQNLFRQQTKNWEDLAWDYLRAAEGLVQKFNDSLFRDVFLDERLRGRVKDAIEPSTGLAQSSSHSELQRVLDDERGGILQTANHYYAETLDKTRKERILARLKTVGLVEGTSEQTIDLAKILAVTHLSNDDQTVNDIHDILKSYYKVAMKRFVDNMVLQVIERHLVGKDGPIRILRPEFVGTMTDDDLEYVAGEDSLTSASRAEAIAKGERLQQALKLAQKGPGR